MLNEHRTEVYIAMSPSVTWDGSFYHDTTGLGNMQYNFAALENLDAFGTFNQANAGATLHVTYDPETQTYAMDYDYYLMDYYDFTEGTWLGQANLLGICKTYELYGRVQGIGAWKKGQKYVPILKL